MNFHKLIIGNRFLRYRSIWWWDESNECYEKWCGDVGGVQQIRLYNALDDYPHKWTHWLPHWAIKQPEVKEND